MVNTWIMKMKLSLFGTSGYSQIVLIGLLAFCCPGIFNALNGLGKAGGNDASTANAANATLYGCFAVFGFFGGAFFNLLGNKILMVAGGSTYAIYALGIYIALYVEGAEFIAIIVGAILGFGAGWFWTAQGAMMMAYATPENRGKYIYTFWILFNLGSVFGGTLSMAINWNQEIQKTNQASYFCFIAIMILGALGGLLLADPENVEREDGQKVEFQKSLSAKHEILGALKVSTEKSMLLLSPLFLASIWFYPYEFNAVNGALFTVRTRGFNSALFWSSQMLGSYIIGRLLDRKTSTQKSQAWQGFAAFATVMNFAFILGATLQYTWDDGNSWDKVWDGVNKRWIGPFEGREIDIGDSSKAWFPMICLIFYGLGNGMMQSYAYWLMATLAKGATQKAAYYSGYYKGIQSLGACISWLMDLYFPFKPQFWTCWSLLIVACLPIAFVVRDSIGENDVNRLSISFATANKESITTNNKNIGSRANPSKTTSQESNDISPYTEKI